MYPGQAPKQGIHRQGFPKNSPNAEAHSLKRQFGGDCMNPEDDAGLASDLMKAAEHRKIDFDCQVDQKQFRIVLLNSRRQCAQFRTPGSQR